MTFSPSLLPHLLGVCCALYALQLIRRMLQDFKGVPAWRILLALVAGLISLALAVVFVLAADYVFPVGSAATSATFYIRISFLIPFAYLMAFLAALLLSTLVGRFCPQSIIHNVAYLGVTLIIMAPMANTWFTVARDYLVTL